jgi:hypothetical protein
MCAECHHSSSPVSKKVLLGVVLPICIVVGVVLIALALVYGVRKCREGYRPVVRRRVASRRVAVTAAVPVTVCPSCARRVPVVCLWCAHGVPQQTDYYFAPPSPVSTVTTSRRIVTSSSFA